MKKELKQKKYTTTKTLYIKERVERIDYKKFTTTTLNPQDKACIVYIALLEIQNIVHLSRKAQIALFIINKALIKVFKEYAKYNDIFFQRVEAELPEHTRINDHPIDLKEGKQPLYRPIYSLVPVELKTLKIYIKNNLKNGFIRPLKSPTRVLILFVKKAISFIRLYIDY